MLAYIFTIKNQTRENDDNYNNYMSDNHNHNHYSYQRFLKKILYHSLNNEKSSFLQLVLYSVFEIYKKDYTVDSFLVFTFNPSYLFYFFYAYVPEIFFFFNLFLFYTRLVRLLTFKKIISIIFYIVKHWWTLNATLSTVKGCVDWVIGQCLF